MEIILFLLFCGSYYFAVTTSGRRASGNLYSELKALLLTFSKPERCYSPAVGLVSGLRYRQLSRLLWLMAGVAFYYIYGYARMVYSDPQPLARLLFIVVGGLIVYVIMGNRATLKEIKDTPWYRTQRMFDDF